MSQESGRANVATVQAWLEALGSGTEAAMQAVAELWEAESDFYPVPKFTEAEPCHGHEEIQGFMAHYLDAWVVSEWTTHFILPVANDRVLSRVKIHAEGRASGMPLDGDMYVCVWLRHARLLRVENHLTEKGALYALGFEGTTLESAGLAIDNPPPPD